MRTPSQGVSRQDLPSEPRQLISFKVLGGEWRDACLGMMWLDFDFIKIDEDRVSVDVCDMCQINQGLVDVCAWSAKSEEVSKVVLQLGRV